MNAPSPYALERAMSVLMAVRQRLLEEDPDIASDERLFADMLDGESGDAMQIIHHMVRAALHASSMATAAKIRSQDMQERSRRYASREDTLRGAVMAAMEALSLRRLEEPDFTVGVSAGTPSVQITDVDALPDAFVTIERKPDKSTIGAALKAGQEVAGATLSNATPRLTIRSK